MKRLLVVGGLTMLAAACAMDGEDRRIAPDEERFAYAAEGSAPEVPQSLAYEAIYDARGVYSVVSMDSVGAYAQEPPSAPQPLS